jgi:hypothetical protein
MPAPDHDRGGLITPGLAVQDAGAPACLPGKVRSVLWGLEGIGMHE